MAKAIKKYRVRYGFEGGGAIVVHGTSKEDAQRNATAVLRDLVPILRPYSAKTYTDAEILPNDTTEWHTRDTGWSSYDDADRSPHEDIFGDAPTQIYGRE